MTVVRSLRLALSMPRPLTRLRITRDLARSIRLNFLLSATQLRLLSFLSLPRSVEELIAGLGIERPELFQLLLDLGVELRELGRDGDVYRLKGARAKTLARLDGDDLTALVEEFLLYHSSVYRHLAGRVRGETLGDYLEANASIVARSSRIVEPFVRDFLDQTVAAMTAPQVLDVGCGSGVYLHQVATTRPDAGGVGVDMHPDVVQQARENLRRWGIDERFELSSGDVRDETWDLGGRFDLTLLINNVYYFSPNERLTLFRRLLSIMSKDGLLVVVTMVHARSPGTLNLDLVLASTVGCYPLPDLDALVADLRQSGFGEVTPIRLIPFQPFYGIRASARPSVTRRWTQ